MAEQSIRRGILFMVLSTLVFSAQDGLSMHLASVANPVFVVMIRFWAFAVFVTVLSARREGGLRAAVRTGVPLLQLARGILLALEVIVTIAVFTYLGLAETHAIFAVCPLIVVALSGPVLGERVGWRRWAAVGAGFAGILIILRPGAGVVEPGALLALLGAAMFATYGILTRLASRTDPASASFFWTGVIGAAFMTLVGPFFWDEFSPGDWVLMGILCVTGATAHWLYIKAFEAAEAAAIQPFAYLQLVFASLIGVFAFGERVDGWTVAGAALIVGAGIYAFWRESVRKRRAIVPPEPAG
jgi:drug/metabolite transporter (DMT)-like permease